MSGILRGLDPMSICRGSESPESFPAIENVASSSLSPPVILPSSNQQSSPSKPLFPILAKINGGAGLKARASFNAATPKGSMEIGLENLGNSCFMNSSLQCLLHIEPLSAYFMAGNYRQEVNVNSPLKGQLANSFAQLVKDMSDMKDGGVVTPAHFFKQLQTLAPDLFDYQQQDCQEFLRFVLDGLCEDLCRRKQPVLASNALPALRTRSKSGLMAVKDMPTTLPGGRLSFKGFLAIRDEIKRRGSFHRTLHGSSGDDNDNREGASSSSSSSSVAPLLTAKRSLSKLPLVMLPGANAGIRPEVDLETNGKECGSSSGNGSSRSVEEEAARSWTVYMKFNDSVVADLFAGQLQSTVTCLTCSERSYCFDPFLDLSVPIPRGQETRSSFTTSRLRGRISQYHSAPPVESLVRCTLEECLQSFTGEETLDDENMFHCDMCKAKRKGTKKLAIYRYPPILVVHMKRFKVGRSCREKLTTDIQFPLKGLNLAPFLSSDKDYSENGRRPPLYDLMGVSHHNGTMHGGHYVATIDTNYSNIGGQRWVNFNDSKVTGVGVNSLSGPSAYVLFYKLQEV